MRKTLFLLLLVMAMLALGLTTVLSTRRAAKAERTLNENDLAALGESAEALQSLSLSMEKALLSQDASQTALLLSRIGRDAGDARRALSFLPMEEAAVSDALSLTEGITDAVDSWLPSLIEQGALASSDRETLSELLRQCTLLSGQLAVSRQEALSGQRSIRSSAGHASPTPTPRVITQLPDAKGLPRTEISEGQAMTLARAFVGEERVTGLQRIPDMQGPIAAWGIAVQTQDALLNVYVTRIGGKVLLMSPETAEFQEALTVDACREAADAFLVSRGFPSMVSEYHQVYNGLCVLSYVYVQDHVMMYPDRLTVQVRMDTGEVVGLEASAYWQNHTFRRTPTPKLTVEDARAHLSPDVSEQSARLCLFPEDDREALCWEFSVTYRGEPYLIYIDAQEGREVALQKLILLDNGVMAA